jgi:Cft2 family RNA processing exonuclease
MHMRLKSARRPHPQLTSFIWQEDPGGVRIQSVAHTVEQTWQQFVDGQMRQRCLQYLAYGARTCLA